MKPAVFMKGGTYVDHVLTPGMTPEAIRQAVAAGKLVVAVDDAGIAIQIDKALLARIARRQKFFKPSPQTVAPADPNTRLES